MYTETLSIHYTILRNFNSSLAYPSVVMMMMTCIYMSAYMHKPLVGQHDVSK